MYVLTDAEGRALYVGKATNLRRRLRAHFADRRWRAIKPGMSRASGAEWREVGSELEALLREAALIEELQPPVNVQTGAPALDTRSVPRAVVRDVLAVLPSVEEDSVELVAAAVDGRWMIQRTRRSGADLHVHAQRIMKFFRSALSKSPPRSANSEPSTLAPIVFSWLAGRGAETTRLNPDDISDARALRERLAALYRDDRLFHERLHQC